MLFTSFIMIIFVNRNPGAYLELFLKLITLSRDFGRSRSNKKIEISTRMKERIRLIMEKAKMSQQDFAAKLGISPASLSSIFTGRTNPTNNHVQAIHRVFPEINVNWLLFGEGEMYTVPDGTDSNVTAESAMAGEPAKVPQGNDRSQMGVEPQLFNFGNDGQVSPSSHPAVPNAAAFPSYIPFSDSVKTIDKHIRKVKEIRVFFDDGTYETFFPSPK